MSLGMLHDAGGGSEEGDETGSSDGAEGEEDWYWHMEADGGEEEEEGDEEQGQLCDCGAGTDHQCEVIVDAGKCSDCSGVVGCTGDCCDRCSSRHKGEVKQKAEHRGGGA